MGIDSGANIESQMKGEEMKGFTPLMSLMLSQSWLLERPTSNQQRRVIGWLMPLKILRSKMPSNREKCSEDDIASLDPYSCFHMRSNINVTKFSDYMFLISKIS